MKTLFIISILSISIWTHLPAQNSQSIHCELVTSDNCSTYRCHYKTNIPLLISSKCLSWKIYDSSINYWINMNSRNEINSDELLRVYGICNCYSCSQNFRTLSDSGTIEISLCNCDSSMIEFTKRTDHLPTETQQWISQDLKMGDTLELPHIYFVPNLSKFEASAYTQLDALYQLLLFRPELNIEVLGHVNGVKSKNTMEFQQLSESRAKAVVKYLVKRGVTQNRLSYSGYGNTKMAFPNAKSDEEMAKNRRVEILIK